MNVNRPEKQYAVLDADGHAAAFVWADSLDPHRNAGVWLLIDGHLVGCAIYGVRECLDGNIVGVAIKHSPPPLLESTAPADPPTASKQDGAKQ